MVHDAVDDGGGHVVVAEHGSPAGKFVVCGYDQASFFITVRDDLEEEAGAFGIDRQVSEFVNLCRYRHRWIYADTAIMPIRAVAGRSFPAVMAESGISPQQVIDIIARLDRC